MATPGSSMFAESLPDGDSSNWTSGESAMEFSSTSTSSSEGGQDAEEMLKLSWTDALTVVFPDVQPQPEPVCTSDGKPILAIEYSPQFAFVVGLYRAMRPAMSALVRSTSANIRAQCHGASAGSTAMARWFLLTAFTIRQCSSHYTAWSDRRELVLNPHAFWAATDDRLQVIPLAVPAGAYVDEETDRTLRVKHAQAIGHILEVKSAWLPWKSSLPEDARELITGESAAVSALMTQRLTLKALLHAIVWELATSGTIGRMYHKNFQVWHHRKELLAYALEKMIDLRLAEQGREACPQDRAVRDDVRHAMLQSQEAFEAALSSAFEVAFAQLDERIITAEVIENVDSKNYHVWTHRGGFIHAFSFLVQGPPAARWRTEWLALCGDGEADCEAAFTVDKEWLNKNACMDAAPTPPGAPITDEFDFTAKVINADCFNNSAWCHRMFLLTEDVVRALLKRYAVGIAEDRKANGAEPHAETRLTLPELLRVLKYVCKREIDFALQWACYQPSNECAFVYARGVAELFQSATLRLKLHAAMSVVPEERCSAAGSEKEKIAQLLTRELRSPVPAACTGFTNNSQHDEDVARYFINASRFVDWRAYLDTFSLLFYQQDVMAAEVVPRATHRYKEIHHIVAELIEMADRTPDPDELEKLRREKLDALYRSGSQHLVDNLHQVRSALYHSHRSFLEQTWLLYWRANRREEVAAARPPESYAQQGITEAILDESAWSRNVASARRLGEVDMFLEKEAMALTLAKALTIDDPVRIKYWRHEARAVMMREY